MKDAWRLEGSRFLLWLCLFCLVLTRFTLGIGYTGFFVDLAYSLFVSLYLYLDKRPGDYLVCDCDLGCFCIFIARLFVMHSYVAKC